jgi:hypothetical protein
LRKNGSYFKRFSGLKFLSTQLSTSRMSDIIGVKSALNTFKNNIEGLKRELLLFDRIAIDKVETFFLKRRHQNNDLVRELRWLYEQELIISGPNLLDSSIREDATLQLELQPIEKLESVTAKGGTKTPEELGRFLFLLELHTRLCSIILNRQPGVEAHPLLLVSLSDSPLPNPKQNVLEVVLNQLPVPSEHTPWEHILEFRSDPDSKGKLLSLKNWVSDISRTDLTPLEIEQRLEYLLDQYERHMKLHKMKVKRGALETVVVSTAEIAEDLVKFKWGKLAQSLFAFKHRKLALLEGELTAPGSELAYIVKTKGVF